MNEAEKFGHFLASHWSLDPLPITYSRRLFPPQPWRALRREGQDERDHRALVQNYVQEYVQYVQTFGFVVISVRSAEEAAAMGRTGRKQWRGRGRQRNRRE